MPPFIASLPSDPNLLPSTPPIPPDVLPDQRLTNQSFLTPISSQSDSHSSAYSPTHHTPFSTSPNREVPSTPYLVAVSMPYDGSPLSPCHLAFHVAMDHHLGYPRQTCQPLTIPTNVVWALARSRVGQFRPCPPPCYLTLELWILISVTRRGSGLVAAHHFDNAERHSNPCWFPRWSLSPSSLMDKPLGTSFFPLPNTIIC